jgi:hypothetical protein
MVMGLPLSAYTGERAFSKPMNQVAKQAGRNKRQLDYCSDFMRILREKDLGIHQGELIDDV